MRPRVSDPATYRSGTPRLQPPAVTRWHTLLHGLATAIHETSGLEKSYWNYGFYIDNPWSHVKFFKGTSTVMVLFVADVDVEILFSSDHFLDLQRGIVCVFET